MTGSQLEEDGWRQGSVVSTSNIQRLIDSIGGISFTDDLVFLVASQSCDIANNNVDTDQYVEFSVARKIDLTKGHLTHNKNPRILHTNVTCRTSDGDVFVEESLELMAFERVVLHKESLVGLQPDSDRVFEDRQLKSYVAWLAARYSRPALPTKFNDRIRVADPKGKLRDKAKKEMSNLLEYMLK